ncbi:MAG: TVP38/TMEM64 family protein [Rhodobacterales bacterium]|nr:TVP38/TMEM64 family protein [Rhodobacterales bacterium]
MPPVKTSRTPGARAAWLRRAPILLMLAAAIAGAVLLRDDLSFESLAIHRADLLAFRDAHYLWSVLAFIGAYVAIVALSLPGGMIATLTGGFLFGLFPGVIYNVLAAGTGAVILFLAARAGFGESLARRLEIGGGRVARLQAGLRRNEWSVLFLMRLVPLVPFFLANLVPAFVGTSLWRFAVSTYLGIIPGGLVFTSVGSGLGEVFARGAAPDLGILFTPPVLLPLLGLAALACLPVILRALRSNSE